MEVSALPAQLVHGRSGTQEGRRTRLDRGMFRGRVGGILRNSRRLRKGREGPVVGFPIGLVEARMFKGGVKQLPFVVLFVGKGFT